MRVCPLPISSKDFAGVVSYYAAKERKLPATLSMISAVSFAHTVNGFPSPSQNPTFSLVLRGKSHFRILILGPIHPRKKLTMEMPIVKTAFKKS